MTIRRDAAVLLVAIFVMIASGCVNTATEQQIFKPKSVVLGPGENASIGDDMNLTVCGIKHTHIIYEIPSEIDLRIYEGEEQVHGDILMVNQSTRYCGWNITVDSVYGGSSPSAKISIVREVVS